MALLVGAARRFPGGLAVCGRSRASAARLGRRIFESAGRPRELEFALALAPK